MKTYIVTISERHPAAGERPSQIEIEAANKKAAVSAARAQVGFRSRFDSPLTYSAKEA
jgi:hypothetical protein